MLYSPCGAGLLEGFFYPRAALRLHGVINIKHLRCFPLNTIDSAAFVMLSRFSSAIAFLLNHLNTKARIFSFYIFISFVRSSHYLSTQIKTSKNPRRSVNIIAYILRVLLKVAKFHKTQISAKRFFQTRPSLRNCCKYTKFVELTKNILKINKIIFDVL